MRVFLRASSLTSRNMEFPAFFRAKRNYKSSPLIVKEAPWKGSAADTKRPMHFQAGTGEPGAKRTTGKTATRLCRIWAAQVTGVDSYSPITQRFSLHRHSSLGTF